MSHQAFACRPRFEVAFRFTAARQSRLRERFAQQPGGLRSPGDLAAGRGPDFFPPDLQPRRLGPGHLELLDQDGDPIAGDVPFLDGLRQLGADRLEVDIQGGDPAFQRRHFLLQAVPFLCSRPTVRLERGAVGCRRLAVRFQRRTVRLQRPTVSLQRGAVSLRLPAGCLAGVPVGLLPGVEVPLQPDRLGPGLLQLLGQGGELVVCGVSFPGVSPYKDLTGRYIEPNLYQIISAGRDGAFGPGGTWNPNTGYASSSPGADDMANFSTAALGSAQN